MPLPLQRSNQWTTSESVLSLGCSKLRKAKAILVDSVFERRSWPAGMFLTHAWHASGPCLACFWPMLGMDNDMVQLDYTRPTTGQDTRAVPGKTSTGDTKTYQIIVPLSLWFTKHPSQYLPLAAVAGCNDIKVAVKLRPFADLAYKKAFVSGPRHCHL